jgi:hypothetical protein
MWVESVYEKDAIGFKSIYETFLYSGQVALIRFKSTKTMWA